MTIFEELLHRQDLDLDTNFLLAGGDSLLIAVLMHHIHERFDVTIPFAAFLELPTAGHLAALVQTAAEDRGMGVSPVPQDSPSRPDVVVAAAPPLAGWRVLRCARAEIGDPAHSRGAIGSKKPRDHWRREIGP